MSMNDVDAFFERIDADESFADRLAAVGEDPVAARLIVSEAGFDLDPVEVRLGFLERFGADLSEEQLDAIAGGLSHDQNMAVVAGVSIGGAGIAIGVAAAAAAI